MSEEDKEPASPTCSLSEAPPNYGFASTLTAPEVATLLAQVAAGLRAGETAEAESRIRESLPLIAEPEVRSALAAMVAEHRLAVPELERLRHKITRG